MLHKVEKEKAAVKKYKNRNLNYILDEIGLKADNKNWIGHTI